jgi:hypothetical protein
MEVNFVKFAILSNKPKTTRLQEIIDKHVDPKTDTYYYDTKTSTYEKTMIELCKKHNIKTFETPRACEVADFVFVIYPDATERTVNS